MTTPPKLPATVAPFRPWWQRALRSLRLWLTVLGFYVGASLGGMIGNFGLAGRGGAIAIWTWLVGGLLFAFLGFKVAQWVRNRPKKGAER